MRIGKKLFFASLAVFLLSSTAASASMLSLDVQTGTFEDGIFQKQYGEWNSDPNTPGHAFWTVGLSNPGIGQPLINNSDGSLPPFELGSYYAYMTGPEFFPLGSAVQVTAVFDDSTTAVSVFRVGDLAVAANWTRLAGGHITLGATGITGADALYGRSVTTDGSPEAVLALHVSTPEPASVFLMGLGIAVLPLIRRRRSRA